MDKKEAAALRLKERTTSKRFKLPEGTTTFRVLPNARGLEEKEYIEYAMHSNVGARKGYLRCGKNIRGQGTCWLCDEQIPKLEKSSSASNRKLAEEMKRKECFAVQIAYVSEGKWTGPVLWEMSPSISNKLLGLMARRDISHPQNGYNLSISRTGTTMTATRYSDIDRDDEKSPVKESILAKLQPFNEVLRKYDEAKQKQEYFGHEQEEENTSGEPDADEEEVKPVKKPVKAKPAPVEEEDEGAEEEIKPAKKPAKPAPAEEEGEEDAVAAADDDDIPYLEDEEGEDVPKPKAGKGKPKPVDTEEEEEVTVEEDEEVKPKAKAKTRPVVEDEEDEPKPKPSKKPARVVEDEEDEPPARPAKKRPTAVDPDEE